MIYRIVHRTTYKYKYPVSVGNHVACLKPRSLPRHRLAQSELHIKPSPATITERVDYFGNHLCFFTIEEPHDELVVEARSEVVMEKNPALLPPQSPPWEEAARMLQEAHDPAALEAFQFRFESPRIRIRPEFASYALAVVYGHAADARGRSGFDRTDSPGLSIRIKSYKCANPG